MRSKLLKSLALGITVSLVGLTTAADALAQIDSYKIFYYADASLTGPFVGREGINCTGHYYFSGVVTDYYTYTDVICPE